jgi:hypothetical protein
MSNFLLSHTFLFSVRWKSLSFRRSCFLLLSVENLRFKRLEQRKRRSLLDSSKEMAPQHQENTLCEISFDKGRISEKASKHKARKKRKKSFRGFQRLLEQKGKELKTGEREQKDIHRSRCLQTQSRKAPETTRRAGCSVEEAPGRVGRRYAEDQESVGIQKTDPALLQRINELETEVIRYQKEIKDTKKFMQRKVEELTKVEQEKVALENKLKKSQQIIGNKSEKKEISNAISFPVTLFSFLFLLKL